MHRLSLFVLLLGLTLSGCQAQPSQWVELKGQRFHVEVVDDEPRRQLGLMHRETLPDNQGMLFLFEHEGLQAFWMKNTLIPLDILYFDAERRLVSVSRDVPPCKSARCPNYPSTGPALYVLELNAGQAAALGVGRGDVLTFSPDIPAKGKP